MKLTIEDNPIVASGVEGRVEFSIKASPKAFAILSSGLYSDKIAAPIRELSTNAADAHVEAGKADLPFKVTLPTSTNPEFKVRDFGYGMSREKLETIYTTYFESDKTNSNAQTGCLGLGSKSPWTYTDAFHVTSYQGGRKFTYAAIINEERKPELNFFGEWETDEDDGLEVSFAVKQQDIDKFVEKAKVVYRFFKVLPNVTSHTDWQALTPKYKYKFNGFAVRDTDGSAYAIMGNIGYPIQSAHFDSPVRDFLSLPIDIYFDIGDLEMTASREGLEYFDRVIKVISGRVEECIEELQSFVSSEVEKAVTHWDKIVLNNKSKKDFGKIYEILHKTNKLAKVPEHIYLGDLEKVERKISFSDKWGSYSRKQISSITPDHDVTVLYDKNRLIGSVAKTVFYATRNSKKTYLFRGDCDKFILDNGIPVVDITCAPAPIKIPRVPNKLNKDEFRGMQASYIGSNGTTTLKSEENHKVKSGYVVYRFRNDLSKTYYTKLFDQNYSPTFNRLFTLYNELAKKSEKIDSKDVYFVNSVNHYKATHIGLVDIVEHIKSYVDDYVSKNDMYEQIIDTVKDSDIILSVAKVLKAKGLYGGDILTFADNNDKIKSSNTSIISLAKYFGHKPKKHSLDVLKKMAEKIYENYKFMNLINASWDVSSWSTSEALYYSNLIKLTDEGKL